MANQKIYLEPDEPPNPEKGKGKGWGKDGRNVTGFNDRRTKQYENVYTGFRPRTENEGYYFVIRRFLKHKQVRKSFSSLFNALLEGLKTACEQTAERDEHGRISIEVNLGRIYLE